MKMCWSYHNAQSNKVYYNLKLIHQLIKIYCSLFYYNDVYTDFYIFDIWSAYQIIFFSQRDFTYVVWDFLASIGSDSVLNELTFQHINRRKQFICLGPVQLFSNRGHYHEIEFIPHLNGTYELGKEYNILESEEAHAEYFLRQGCDIGQRLDV